MLNVHKVFHWIMLIVIDFVIKIVLIYNNNNNNHYYYYYNNNNNKNLPEQPRRKFEQNT